MQAPKDIAARRNKKVSDILGNRQVAKGTAKEEAPKETAKAKTEKTKKS